MSIARRLARLEALPPPPPSPPWEDSVPPAVVAYLNALDGEALAALRRAHDAKQAGVLSGIYFKLSDDRAPLPGVVVIDQLFEGIATRQTPTITVRQAQCRLLRWAYHRLRHEAGAERRSALAEYPTEYPWGGGPTWERLLGAVPTREDWWPMIHRNESPERLHHAGELWIGYWRRGGTRDADTLVALRFGLAELVLLAADDEPAATGDDTEGGE